MKMRQVWYLRKEDIKSPDTIHQVLMFGSLKDIKSLRSQVGENTVKELFLNHPKKVYTNAALNFIKNFILRISAPVDEQKYLKSTPRYIR